MESIKINDFFLFLCHNVNMKQSGLLKFYGERLASALRQKNLKQSDLAAELGITQAAVSKIINGSQYLDFELAVKACKVLDITPGWLAYGDDGEKTFHRNPQRQRIEYLLSIINEAEYPLVIVAMEELIEVKQKTAKDKKEKKKSNPKN